MLPFLEFGTIREFSKQPSKKLGAFLSVSFPIRIGRFGRIILYGSISLSAFANAFPDAFFDSRQINIFEFIEIDRSFQLPISEWVHLATVKRIGRGKA
jgi:hypothetical protein